jgi:ketosteroid isomerase-like protein
MRARTWISAAALAAGAALGLAACGGSGGSGTSAAAQHAEDVMAIDQIEQKWHEAASKKDVDLMMSLWAPDATFQAGPVTVTGRKALRTFFATKAAPFQPQNHWISDTPAYKIRITVNGDKGTLYFECHYIDVDTSRLASIVAADNEVQKINGKWLIVHTDAATPTLTP